jgi:hypothetical protein
MLSLVMPKKPKTLWEISIVIALATVILLASCSSNHPDNGDDDVAADDDSAPADDDAVLDDDSSPADDDADDDSVADDDVDDDATPSDDDSTPDDDDTTPDDDTMPDDDTTPGDDDTTPADDDSVAADVIVDPTTPGPAIADDFLGLSVEWSSVVDYLGDGAGGARATTVQLLRNFEPEGNTLAVRIGGNSQDLAWWNPDGLPLPPGVEIDLGPSHMATLAALNTAAGAPFVLGLNLALGDASNAAALVDGAFAAIAREAVLAFELGNEPDYYWSAGYRPFLYNYDDYQTELDAFHDGIAALVSPVPPFAAPALGGVLWLHRLNDFFAAEQDRVALVTTHVYPYTVCDNLPAPPPAALLSNYATKNIGRTYAPVATAAHDAGYSYRMDELNTVSCGGADGVSNVYAAALWAIDVAFRLADAGLDGLNFHTPGTYYGVFSYDDTGALEVHPLYYGMRFFSLATAQGGQRLPVEINLTRRVRAWATLGQDGAVRVALVNEELEGDDTVRLRVSGRSAAATLVRLRAPALDARTGLTLGGQTWDGSVDGLPLGDLVTEPAPFEGDAYVISLPALQAVVVTVPL